MAEAAPSWAVVTPSYAGDYRRCVLLCRSMDVFLKGPWHHYIVVDRPHFAMFKGLAGPHRTILLTDDVMPDGMKLMFNLPFVGGRSVWWSRVSGLTLGWHMQQMVKIGIALKLREDGLVYCDSDVFFLKHFDVADFCREGRFRLYRTEQPSKLEHFPNPGFLKSALPLLGLPAGGSHYSYVENIITWRRQSVVDLCAFLAKRNSGHWHRAFRNRMQISEYTIYGLYLDDVIHDEISHYRDPVKLCRTHWSHEKLSVEAVSALCTTLNDNEVAVGVQSFAGVDMALLEAQFDAAAKAGA